MNKHLYNILYNPLDGTPSSPRRKFMRRVILPVVGLAVMAFGALLLAS